MSPMTLGISGHRNRPGIDWDWVALQIRAAFQSRAPVRRAFTSLAAGSDQIFAREALALNVPVTAIIPLADYETILEAGEVAPYNELLRRCQVITLQGSSDLPRSFLEAGQKVAESADILVAVWDGQPALGVGGTADIVRYSLGRGQPVLHINPVTKTVQPLGIERRA